MAGSKPVSKSPDAKLRDKWLNRIKDEEKAHKSWRARAQDAENAYCEYGTGDSGKDTAPPEFPVFYTTVNLIQGKINGSPPKPDVRKRHPASPQGAANAAVPPQTGMAAMGPGGVQPPPMPGNVSGMAPNAPLGGIGIGPGAPQMGAGMPPQLGGPGQQPAPMVSDPTTNDNTIALCIERCLTYTIDTTSFTNDAGLAVRDYLVSGMGQAKVELETEFEDVPVINPETGEPLLDQDGQPLTTTEIVSQELHLRHFHHSQFRWEPAKDWRRVQWVAFDHAMTAEDIEDQFGIELDENYTGGGKEGDIQGGQKPLQQDKYEQTYLVHEVWDKRKRQRIFVSECYDKVLDQEDDPLGLDGFFPCPPPMMANVNGRELTPNPDFWQYQYLVKQCKTLSIRLKKLTEQVKDIKFYDSSFGQYLKAAAGDYDDGTFVAVPQLLDKLRATQGKADTSRIICELDMANKVQVLQALSAQLDALEQKIYKINGIADIQRGVSNPNDTATAQRIKDEWADIRTGQRTATVALWYRDIFRLESEILCKHFKQAQIQAMSGISLTPEQIGTMRSDLATAYSVDVESNSTMIVNDSQNVQELTAFLQALEPLLMNLAPAVKTGAIPGDLVKEILNLVVDTYKPGRDLQQAVEAMPNTLQQLNMLTGELQQAQQQAQQAQQQLQQYQQGEEARKNAQTQADVQNKTAQAGRTQAETALLTPPEAKKREAEAVAATVAASQASRQDLIDGMVTGIQ